ncbi:MAG: UvrD-helicase domain-containing protein [Candidatus Krumholzibacteriales bacterium]
MSRRDSRPVDFEQRKIAVEEIDRSLCLEAGAGTGKTTLLVERYISIIKSGNAPCTGIVAITFTDAAANEMKERIRGRIAGMIDGREEGSGDKAGDSGVENEVEQRLRAALKQIERAPVATIHSFASSVIRDYPVEAGIDPDFNLITGVDYQLFMEDCWKDFLSEYGNDYGEPIGALLRVGGSVEKLREMADLYYNRRFERYVSGDIHGRKTDERERPGKERRPFCQIYGEYVEKLASMAEKYCADERDRGKQEIDKLNKHLETASALQPARREEYLLKIRIPKGYGAKKNWKPPEKSDQQKQLRKKLSELQSACRSDYLDGVRERLEAMLENYLEYIEDRKRAEGALDFDDLLIRMRQLLDNREVVKSLRRRFQYILVDEFQDTNSIQAEIIFILAGFDGRERQAEEGGGSLFIVGDPKQSIYRFRKADVEVYERVKEVFSKRDSHLKIRQNFRSGENVLNWVNQTFRRIIRKPESGRFQPEYEPVIPHRDDPGSSVMLLELDKGDEKLKADEMREKEGIAVVRAIRHLVDSGFPVRDLDAKEFRPVRFSDIALIYRATTGMEYYENPLKAEEIPYLVSGGSFFFAAQEVRDLANAVWTVENHWDRVYLIAVLRSLLFGFSDEEIFLFVKAGGELDYLSAVPEGNAFDSFREAFSLLRGLHLERNRRGAAGTVKRLISRTGYREATVFRSHSRQRLGNIEKVIRKGREFDNGFHSFRQFALWFRDQEKLGTRENEYSLMEKDQDAVRLMSIHKSKGQQFPVVFMVNLHQGITQGENVYIEGGRRVEFKLNGDWHTGGYGKAEEMDRERDAAEIKRLLYVSATRAGDLLIIPDVRGGSRKNYISLIEDFLPSPGGSRSAGKEEDQAGPAAEFVRSMENSALPPYTGARTEFRKVPPPGSSSRIEGDRKMKEWGAARQKLLEKGMGDAPVITPSSEKESAPAADTRDVMVSGAGRGDAAAFGTAFHRVMESMNFDDIGGLDRIAELIARENGIERRRDELAGLVRKTVESEFMGRVFRSERIMREVPFTVPLEPGPFPGSGRYLSGKIDLLFISEGVWTAVDYKTDNITDPENRLPDYLPQGAMYMAGMKALGIDLAGGVIFYFVRPGLSITLSAGDLSGVELPRSLTGLI